MMHCLWFLFSVFIIFSTGNAVLRIIDNGKLYGTLSERLALSYGLGIGAIAVIQLYAMFIRIPLNKINILLLISPFIIVRIFYFARDRAFGKIRMLIPDFLKNNFLIRERLISKRFSVLEALLIIYLIVLCLMMLFVCVSMPMYTWDSRAIWGLKAKMLFHNQTIFTDDFLDPYRFHNNTPYPLLIPLAENFFYNMLGVVDDFSVKIIFALFYVCLLSLLYTTQRKYFSASKPHSLIFTALFASLPFLFVIYSGSVPSAYSDFPLAFFYTFTLVYLLRYLQARNTQDVVIACLFACFCLFTKNEGMPLFLISVILLITESIRGKCFLEKKDLRALLIYLVLPISALIPWFIIKSRLPTLNYNNPMPFLLSADIVRYLSLLKLITILTFREMFTNFKSWGIFWFLVIAAVILILVKSKKTHPERLEIYLLLIPVIYYVFIITPVYLYTSTKLPLEVEFSGTSFERLRLHVLPLLLLFVSLKINRLFSKEG